MSIQSEMARLQAEHTAALAGLSPEVRLVLDREVKINCTAVRMNVDIKSIPTMDEATARATEFVFASIAEGAAENKAAAAAAK